MAKKKFRMPRPVPTRPLPGTEKKSAADLQAEASHRQQGRPFKAGEHLRANLPKVPSHAAKPKPSRKSDLNFDARAPTLLQTKSQAVRDISRLTEVVEAQNSARDDLQSATDCGQRVDGKVEDQSQQRGTFYHTQVTSMAMDDSGHIKPHLNVGSGSIKTATLNPENSETRKDHLRILGNISEDHDAQQQERAEDEGDYAGERFEEEDAAGKLSSVRVGSGLESGPAASS